MINWLAQNGLAALGFGGYVIIGGLALLGYFRKDDSRQAQSNQVADGLIDRLQKTVDQNGKDMTAMSARIDDQQKEIHQLQGSNDAYLKIITLRDPATAKVFEEAPAIYAIVRETNGDVKAAASSLDELTQTLSRFIDALQPVLIHLELSKPSPAGV